MWVARYEIPRNIVTEMIPMIRRVSEAFFDCGRRNAGTPLEIASTPVRAVEPDENACRITNRPTVRTVLAELGGRQHLVGHDRDTRRRCTEPSR